ncbi:MAG: L-fucose mutarotase [Lentisphaerae bacterium]|jgi:L-fucose mutarotase|nr:L-fucose mutarotase [Lentisphaerota bacterium]MBR2874185.1 L-fucose mutarotase [Lentisphaeria bacterium]
MLKGISPLLFPELLKVLAEMGHGDEIVLSDAHFPAYAAGVPVLQAPGVDVPQLLNAILNVWKLDQYVEKPAVMMAPVKGDTLDENYVALCRKVMQDNGEKGEIDFIDRFDFYDRTKKVHCVVVTGETRKYGNLLLKKGVIC